MRCAQHIHDSSTLSNAHAMYQCTRAETEANEQRPLLANAARPFSKCTSGVTATMPQLSRSNKPDFTAETWASGKRESACFKNLLMPLFLMGCFPVDFQEVKRPLRTKSAKRPIKVGKRPINEGKRPVKAKLLVGVSVGSLMGCFRASPPWWKTAPLKRPIKRSMHAVLNNRSLQYQLPMGNSIIKLSKLIALSD